MNDDQILLAVSKDLGIRDDQVSKQLLIDRVNELINNNFEKLVSILYRMDVNENKLKQLLKENPGSDAGLIITDLMIERQLQKNKSRQDHKRDENISDDEKW